MLLDISTECILQLFTQGRGLFHWAFCILLLKEHCSLQHGCCFISSALDLCCWGCFQLYPSLLAIFPSFPTSQRSCSFAVGTDLPGRGEHPLYSTIFISIPSFLCFWAAPCWCYCLAFVNTLLIWASPVCLQKAMASVWPQILLPLPPFRLFHCQLFGFIFLGFYCSFAAVVLQVLFSLCASANL